MRNKKDVLYPPAYKVVVKSDEIRSFIRADFLEHGCVGSIVDAAAKEA
ncbi:MAG TPA: hypothetical protein VGR84_14575 [Candidatus Acidoferrales bacterium]|nr:hypothetical protein [Candidatus Acidoferrales bacterium]